MATKRRRSSDEREANEQDSDITSSEPIEDRSSRFIAYFSPSMKPKALQGIPEIASASHKIIGWRRESNQQSITKAVQYVTGSDDDGEKYGGKRVEKVMDTMRVSGTCVVARWYGGIMLGPVRFNHIEACARDAIHGWLAQQQEEGQKRRKIEEDAHEALTISGTLPERDQSIRVLRKLAAEKEASLKAASPELNHSQTSSSRTEGTPAASSQSPSNIRQGTPDYSKMSLEGLRRMEKARDATIAFLLKRIDKAEAELVAVKASATESNPEQP